MQTMYYTTRNFIRHTDNVVDLTEYRRRLDRARQEQAFDFAVECEEEPIQAVAAAPHRSTLLLENCASFGIIVMTLAFTMQVIFG